MAFVFFALNATHKLPAELAVLRAQTRCQFGVSFMHLFGIRPFGDTGGAVWQFSRTDQAFPPGSPLRMCATAARLRRSAATDPFARRGCSAPDETRAEPG